MIFCLFAFKMEILFFDFHFTDEQNVISNYYYYLFRRGMGPSLKSLQKPYLPVSTVL